jgi:uncharacterized membrane protein
MNNSLDLTLAFKSAWDTFKKNAGTFASITFVFLVLTVLLGAADRNNSYSSIPGTANTLISFFAAYVMTRISLRALRGETPTWKDAFTVEWSQFGWYILAAILTGIIYGAGFILFVIPGLFLIVRLALTNFALIDEDLMPIDSMKRSWALTRGHFWQMFLAGVIIVGLNIVGTALLGIGIVISSPLSFLFSVHIYDRLRSASVPAVSAKVV